MVDTTARKVSSGGASSVARPEQRNRVLFLTEPTVTQKDSEETFDRLISEGEQRLGRSWLGLLSTGLLGGIDVGIGVFALLLVEHYTHSVALGALAFSIGFLALTISHSELFTEGFLVPVTVVVARRAKLRSLLRLWWVSLLANLAGGWLITGLLMAAFPILRSEARELATYYIDLGTTWLSLALAVLGGVIITLMTHMQHSTNSEVVRLVPPVLMGFLLSIGKLNHAVVVSLLCFAALQAGASFGYADWLGLLVVAVLGNMIGGIAIVTGLRLMQVPHKVLAERAK